MKASLDQIETLRNLANNAERLGLTAASQAGFITHAKAKTGDATQEEVNCRIHGIREIIRTSKGSAFADSIA